MKASALVGSLTAFGSALRDNGAEHAARVATELADALGRNGNVNVPDLSESTSSGEVVGGGASANDAAPIVKSLAQLLGPIAKKDLKEGLSELVEVLERLGSAPLIGLGPAKKVASASRSRSRRGAGPVNQALVDNYLRRLEAALGDDVAFSALYRELEQDAEVTKLEAVAIANRFMGPVAASTSRPKALQRILFRHRKLMDFMTGSESIGGKAA
jgi:hypothetical protein